MSNLLYFLLISLPLLPFISSFTYQDLTMTNLNSDRGISINPSQSSSSSTNSWIVSSAGDFNNDQIDDIILGIPSEDLVYIIFGSRDPLYDFSLPLSSTQGIKITGESSGDLFGSSVGSAGDVNADGLDDIIIGAPSYNSDQGAAYIIYGRSNPSDTSVSSELLASTPRGFKMIGESTGDLFGTSVSFAGDLDRDGYDDVVIGAPGYNGNSGAGYVVLGKILNNMPGTWPDVPMSGSYEGFIVKGANANDGLGTAVSNAGDIDKDSYDDVMIGAPQALGAGSTASDQTGAVYVVYGQSSLSSMIDLSAALPSNCIKINGENAGDQFGASVGFAGNVNKDYYDDIIIGAPGVSSDTGAAYIIFGASSLGTLDLSSGSAWTGIKLTGNSAGDLFGAAVSRVGNWNSDQYDDVVIGAPGEGVVYVVYGGATTYFGSVSGYSEKNMLIGGAVGFGGSLGGVDDFNGNDKPDVVIGGDIGESYVVFDQRCPRVCTGCIDIYSCTGCWNGYELSTSLTCEVEESSNFLLDPDTPNIALQISLFIASGLCIGKSAPLTIGFLLRIIRNIRFFSIYYPENLLEVLQDWISTILTIRPPDTLTFQIASSKDIPAIFTYYDLQARFFLNFWSNLLMIAGSLVALILLNGLRFVMKSNNRPELIHKVLSFLATASINFFIVQFYGVFDVIVFYCVLEFRSIDFNSALEDISFSFAVIFLALGTALLGFHIFLLIKLKNIRSQKSPDLVTAMSAETHKKYSLLRILHEDFKATGIIQEGFLAILVLRSVLLSIAITTLFEHPLAQTIIFACFVLFTLALMVWKRPFKNLQDTIFHYYFELIIFVVSIGTLVMSILDQSLEESYTTRSRFGKGIKILDIMFNLGGLLYMVILIVQALLELYLPSYIERNKAEIFAAAYSKVDNKNTTLDHSMNNVSGLNLISRDEPSLYLETSNMKGDTSKKFNDYSRQNLLIPPGNQNLLKSDSKEKGLEIQNVVLNLENKNSTSVDKRRRGKRSIYPSPDLALLKSSLQELKKDLDDEIEWKVLDFPGKKASLMQPRITGESTVMVPIQPIGAENFEGGDGKVVVIKNSKKRMVGEFGNK